MSGLDLTIRRARIADVDAVVELVESAYRGDASRVGWTTEAGLLEGRRTGSDEIRPSIEGPDSVMLLAESAAARSAESATARSAEDAAAGVAAGVAADEARLLGCCRLDLEDGRPYFGMFAVSPGAQGQGIGKALMAAAESLAVELWDAAALEMTVLAQRPELLAFYGRHGYLPTGESRPFPYGDGRFGQPLRADLSFVVLVKALVPRAQVGTTRG